MSCSPFILILNLLLMNDHHQEEQRPPRPFWRMPFRKLAMRYFPKVLPQVANRYLRRILNSDPLMLRDLEQSGYRPYQHYLSAEQCGYIEYYLGSPEEFIEYY